MSLLIEKMLENRLLKQLKKFKDLGKEMKKVEKNMTPESVINVSKKTLFESEVMMKMCENFQKEAEAEIHEHRKTFKKVKNLIVRYNETRKLPLFTHLKIFLKAPIWFYNYHKLDRTVLISSYWELKSILKKLENNLNEADKDLNVIAMKNHGFKQVIENAIKTKGN